MRYEKGHKEATRRHIVEVASAQFREHGVAASGLAGIMSAAGLTNGAFYAHFESKEDLVEAVLLDTLGGRERNLRTNLQSAVGIETVLREYLSLDHRDNAPTGCPTAPLVAEIARHPKSTRDAFTAKVVGFIPLFASQLKRVPSKDRRRATTAIYCMMIGALQMARAVSDEKLSREILDNAIDGALRLAGENHS